MGASVAYHLALAGAPVCAGLVGVAYDRMNHQVGQRVMRDLRLELFRAVRRQPRGRLADDLRRVAGKRRGIGAVGVDAGAHD